MHVTKLAVIGTALVAAAIVTVAQFESRASERTRAALATHTTDIRQTASFVTDAIKPAEDALFDKSFGGPIRTVDW